MVEADTQEADGDLRHLRGHVHLETHRQEAGRRRRGLQRRYRRRGGLGQRPLRKLPGRNQAQLRSRHVQREHRDRHLLRRARHVGDQDCRASRPAHHQQSFLFRRQMGRTERRKVHHPRGIRHRLQGSETLVAAHRDQVRHPSQRPRHHLSRCFSRQENSDLLFPRLLQIAEDAAAPERIPDAQYRAQLDLRRNVRPGLLLGHQPQLRRALSHSILHVSGSGATRSNSAARSGPAPISASTSTRWKIAASTSATA